MTDKDIEMDQWKKAFSPIKFEKMDGNEEMKRYINLFRQMIAKEQPNNEKS